MTLPRYVVLSTYWNDEPPTHVGVAMIGSALGLSKPGADEKPEQVEGDLFDLWSTVGDSG